MKLELGCGTAATPGYVHHDRRRHAAHVDICHDLDLVPWPWADASCERILALDVFEHLHPGDADEMIAVNLSYTTAKALSYPLEFEHQGCLQICKCVLIRYIEQKIGVFTL